MLVCERFRSKILGESETSGGEDFKNLLLEDGRNDLARTAPFGKEVDNYGLTLGKKGIPLLLAINQLASKQWDGVKTSREERRS